MTNILPSSSISFIFMINIMNIFSPLLISNAVSNCNDSCRDLNDCSGQLICLSGRCVDDPNTGTQICRGRNNGSTPPPPKNRPAPAPPSRMPPFPFPPRIPPPTPPKNQPAPAPPSMMPPFPFPPRIPPPTPPKNQPAPVPPIIICQQVRPTPPPPRFQPQPLPPRLNPPRPCFWIPHPPRTSQPQPLVKVPHPEYCIPSGFVTCRGQRYPTYTCSPPVNSNTKAKLTYKDFNEGGDDGGPSTCDGKYHKNSESIVALSTGWFDGGSRCGKMINITASNGRNTTAIVVDECDSTRGCDNENAYKPPCKNNVVDGSDAVWKALRLDKNVGIVNATWSIA